MVKTDTGARLSRLEHLKGLLKDRDHVIAADLADELGVSLRTLNRDLALLRDQGLPIDSDRGRGGGLRLDRSWSVGRLHLRTDEVIDLLVSLAIVEQLNSPLLLGSLRPLRHKILAALGPRDLERIKTLRRRILVGPAASTAVASSYVVPAKSILGPVQEAFFAMHCLSLGYADQHGRHSDRLVEPHYLYYANPVWYLLAFDRLRDGVRHFRIDRIRSARSEVETFRPRKAHPFLQDIGISQDGV